MQVYETEETTTIIASFPTLSLFENVQYFKEEETLRTCFRNDGGNVLRINMYKKSYERNTLLYTRLSKHHCYKSIELTVETTKRKFNYNQFSQKHSVPRETKRKISIEWEKQINGMINKITEKTKKAIAETKKQTSKMHKK